jgi:hypothetical protein
MRQRLENIGLRVLSKEEVVRVARETTKVPKVRTGPIYYTSTSAFVSLEWSERTSPETCWDSQVSDSQPRHGILQLSFDKSKPPKSCDLGATVFGRPAALATTDNRFSGGFWGGTMCRPIGRKLTLKTISNLGAGLPRCDLQQVVEIEGEAFSAEGNSQWVVLEQGPGFALGKTDYANLDWIALSSISKGVVRPITSHSVEHAHMSYCYALPTAREDQHVFYCPDGWLIDVSREPMTR